MKKMLFHDGKALAGAQNRFPSLRDSSALFAALTAMSLVALGIVVFLTNGAYLSEFFFLDIRDTGMDFFNSLAETVGGDPYGCFGTLYPPLANLFFYILQCCVPAEISSQWAQHHQGTIAMRGTELDLRTYQAPLILFFAFLLLTVLALSLTMEYLLKDYPYNKVTALACCFCYGTLYAYERGNIILSVLLLILLFVSFYDSERAVMRELALIALAIAAGLKLYPALFGLLLLLGKQWKRALRCICYGVAAFFLPFFVFGGVSDFRLFLDIFFAFNEQGSASFLGYGVQSILATAYEQVFRLTGLALPFQRQFGLLLLMMISAALLICLVKASLLWERLLCLVLLLVFLQPSGGYTLAFFLIPFMAFLRQYPTLERQNVPTYICFLMILLPFPMQYLVRYALVILALAIITLLAIFRCGLSPVLKRCRGSSKI